MEIPLAEVERIMRNAGAEKVTENAVRTLRDSGQELSKELAKDAVKVSRESGRDSVTVEDVRKAVEV
ncbi:MAG: histone family protein [Candidatus Nanohaloarchaea archaeon]